MIIVDTNIISEFMRAKPDPIVIQWFNKQSSRDLYVSVITLAEIGFGLRVMPEGHKTKILNSRFKGFVNRAFEERILSFDLNASEAYVSIMASRQKMGLKMSIPDGQIASIAYAHRFVVATRNIKDFEHCGIEVVNPFESPQG